MPSSEKAPATITIKVSSRVAKAYEALTPDAQAEIRILLNFWLLEITSPESDYMKSHMNQLGEMARSKGISVLELEAILEEAVTSSGA